MAVLGKRVLHPGGRPATEELFRLASLERGQRVLDAGCGTGWTALEMTGRFESRVVALDISSNMLALAADNVAMHGSPMKPRLTQGDVRSLPFADEAFDRVIAEAVTMLTDRPRAAGELVRVCRRGGFVLANEFVWRRVPSDSARQQLREMTPGLQVDAVDGWVEIYRAAGLVDVRTVSGPFGMLTPRGFVVDEGFRRILVIFGRA